MLAKNGKNYLTNKTYNLVSGAQVVSVLALLLQRSEFEYCRGPQLLWKLFENTRKRGRGRRILKMYNLVQKASISYKIYTLT